MNLIDYFDINRVLLTCALRAQVKNLKLKNMNSLKKINLDQVQNVLNLFSSVN
jgi:hypothetical protein